MKIEQIYTGCLAHAAYYIENNGEASLFDPLREIDPYIARAKLDNARIKYVFETHFHADFVSGHIDLAATTGAQIVFGPTAKPSYNALVATDGEIFKVGNYSIKVLHTPGHTMESTTYLLIDENNKEHGIISGDTLFIGDVGRPDLAQHVVKDLNQEKLAGLLYDSLRTKIMPLSDDLIVYPNHGAGSACGKHMSKETTDTLGHQKKVNYALNAGLSKEEFIKELLNGLVTPPGYFPQNVLLNINGYESIDTVLTRATKGLSVDEFELALNTRDVVVIDTRSPMEFAQGFIPQSINIGIDGNFATWVGTLVSSVTQQLLIVAETGREREVAERLSRVGFDQGLGYLLGGFNSWVKAGKPVDAIESVTAVTLASITENARLIEENTPSIASTDASSATSTSVVDVRKASEFDSEHIIGAINLPLDFIASNYTALRNDRTYYVHCAAGYRSMSYLSILRKKGFRNLINVEGGFTAIKKSGLFKLSKFMERVTLL